MISSRSCCKKDFLFIGIQAIPPNLFVYQVGIFFFPVLLLSLKNKFSLYANIHVKNRGFQMFNSENNKIIVLGLYVPILLLACSTNKKQSSHEDCPGYYELKRRIYTFVDTMPEYPGERGELLIFFAKNFTYPKVDYFQGSINLEFVIDIDGKVINEKIVNKETKDLTEVDKEALRVLKRMPKWIPGKCNDKIVPVRILFPLKF